MFDLGFKQIKKALKAWTQVPLWLQTRIAIGKQAYMLRTALGMTQDQLAQKVGTSQRAIVRLEKDEGDPQLSTLQKIAASLNCELLVRFVPKTDIETMLIQNATAKAQDLIGMSVASANIELQKPSERTIASERKRLVQELLSKRRSTLWEK